MEKITELLKELDSYWDAYNDPRIKGAHPKCDDIHEELITLLNELNNDQLINLCESISPDKLEQVAYPLEEISINHPCVAKYVHY